MTSSKPTPNWKEVKHNSKTSKNKISSNTPAFALKNRFEVFSDCTSEDEEDTERGEGDNTTFKRKNPTQLKNSNSRGKQQIKNNIQGRRYKSKLLLYTDSHGRGLSSHLNYMSNKFDAISFVKPGACTKQILTENNIEEEKLKERDVLVFMAGSNDVARNEAQYALMKISETIQKHQDKKIILVDLPIRHDLVKWSCVNLEVKKTNNALKKLSELNRNVSLVEVTSAVRHLHTRHGQHLNITGKRWLANKIEAAASTFLDDKRAPSSECMKRLPSEVSSRAENEASIEETKQFHPCSEPVQQHLEPTSDVSVSSPPPQPSYVDTNSPRSLLSDPLTSVTLPNSPPANRQPNHSHSIDLNSSPTVLECPG